MSDTPTKTQLNKLKVAELRGQLTELGLATNGIKADLVQRLFTHYQEQEAEAEQAVRGPVITLRGSTPSRKSPVAVKKARTTSSPEKEKTELCQLCGEQSVAYRSLKANTLKVEQVRDLLDLDLQANKEAGLASVICNKCCNFLDNWTNGQLENFLSFKRSVIKGQEIIKKKEEADKQRMTVDNR